MGEIQKLVKEKQELSAKLNTQDEQTRGHQQELKCLRIELVGVKQTKQSSFVELDKENEHLAKALRLANKKNARYAKQIASLEEI